MDYPILSDPTRSVAQAYGVLKLGFASRHTFYIGTDGKILRVDRQVHPATSGDDAVKHLIELGVPRKAR